MTEARLALFLVLMFAVACWLSWTSLGSEGEEYFPESLKDEEPVAPKDAEKPRKSKPRAGKATKKKKKKKG